MRLQLIQLQQKEIILTKQNGDFKTELNVVQKHLENANNEISDLKHYISTLQVRQ